MYFTFHLISPSFFQLSFFLSLMVKICNLSFFVHLLEEGPFITSFQLFKCITYTIHDFLLYPFLFFSISRSNYVFSCNSSSFVSIYKIMHCTIYIFLQKKKLHYTVLYIYKLWFKLILISFFIKKRKDHLHFIFFYSSTLFY
jgi:hypothetical protein